jgi:hypothetical protein
MIEALLEKLYVCEDDIWLDCSMSGSNFKITSRLEEPKPLAFAYACVNMIRSPELMLWK